MKLARDLDITQESAWFMAHRLREAFASQGGPFSGPVEADETYMGGKRKNMSKAKRKQIKGSGSVGKTTVVGVKNRPTKEIRARVVPDTEGATLCGFGLDNLLMLAVFQVLARKSGSWHLSMSTVPFWPS